MNTVHLCCPERVHAWDPDLQGVIVGLWFSVDFIPNKEPVEWRISGSHTPVHMSSRTTSEILSFDVGE